MKKITAFSVRGFTLLELLVVIAIMSITLGIGLPSMQSMISSNRLTASANDMVAALLMARSEAIKQIKNSGVSISTTDSTWVAYVGVVANSVQQFSAAKGVKIAVTSSGAADETPTYRPDGRLLDAVAPITVEFSVTGSTEKRVLTIQPSGRVSISSG